MNPDGPLIVQSDREILVETAHHAYSTARDDIAPFTELVKSPEHFHTYRITHLSLWNAASAGLGSEETIERLKKHSRYPVPANILAEIRDYMDRYGRVRLVTDGGGMVLECDDTVLAAEIMHMKGAKPYIIRQIDSLRIAVNPAMRGHLKMALTQSGFPVQDLAGYVKGENLEIKLRDTCASDGSPFVLRDYQIEGAQIFHASGSDKGGSGVIVLPCGSGKTVVALAAMGLVQARTLILTQSITAARQWIREIIDKTHIPAELVSEYSGENKKISPVTVATYQIVTHRKDKDSKFTHFDIFQKKGWGLIIYDEVHLLPAPVFRISAEMQATRRLGLTATLVREDGKETEVFSLIGPKKYDIPWKVLEGQGWIANAQCEEIRVPMAKAQKMAYAIAEKREKIRMASSNPAKTVVVKKLLSQWTEEPGNLVLIIGQYINQLEELSKELNVPLITGKMNNRDRDVLYGLFRSGKLQVLMVSKVGNFAIDLPDANVLIQISGTFGSRQEEAQRLGRVLRPKKNGSQAHFFSIVTAESREQEFAMNRQLFLAEQGYEYNIRNVDQNGDDLADQWED